MTIAVTNLSVKRANTLAVDDATLTLQRGRVTAILGPNGAGKTSLVRALAGLVSGGGRITVDGVPLSTLTLNERARRIGYLPQNGVTAWNVTVRALASLGRLPHRGVLSAQTAVDDAFINDALIATDTAHLADRTVDTLSGGERARAAMARVLAGAPEWIIADEPLANLDPPHQRDVLALFRRAAATGKGVIVILHQLNAAARVADDIVMMAHGRIVAQGTTVDVMTPRVLEATFGMPFDVTAIANRLLVQPRD
jgi:iron complex transport system ATP-binding protein